MNTTLNCFSINKSPYIHPCVFPINNSSFSPKINPPRSTIKSNNETAKQEYQKAKENSRPMKKRQPTIIEVEKAIDAGNFTDNDPNRETEENMNSFTGMLNPFGKNESFAEKQLRETGEWINHKAERRFRSASKPILLFLVKWMLPMWIIALFIFSGIIKLPFHAPFLDDLLL